MGFRLIDQYSLLHMSTGVIMYFFNFSLLTSFIIHFIFEILENTSYGINIINKISFWPGGKPSADTYINIAGDNIFFILGWLLAYSVDYYGSKYGLYSRHIL